MNWFPVVLEAAYTVVCRRYPELFQYREHDRYPEEMIGALIYAAGYSDGSLDSTRAMKDFVLAELANIKAENDAMYRNAFFKSRLN